MNYFRDVSALHDVLGVLYEKAPPEARLAELSRLSLKSGGSRRTKHRFMLRPCSAGTQRAPLIGWLQMQGT
jgi:hypothetical protein